MIVVLTFLMISQSEAHNFFDLTVGSDKSFTAPIDGHWTHTEGHPESLDFDLMLSDMCQKFEAKVFKKKTS